MPAYDRTAATDFEEIDRWHGGVGWLAHPEEDGQRASHALQSADGVWLLDPLDAPGVEDLISDFGDVAGVVVCSNYHARDAAEFATRYGVSVHVPAWMTRVAERIDAPVSREKSVLEAAGFETQRVEPLSLYQETILYRARDRTLVIPDLCSSRSGYPVGDERVGLLLPKRLSPPRERFEGLEPERILFGHGKGIFEDATAALEDALGGARKRFPRAVLENVGVLSRLYLSAVWE